MLRVEVVGRPRREHEDIAGVERGGVKAIEIASDRLAEMEADPEVIGDHPFQRQRLCRPGLVAQEALVPPPSKVDEEIVESADSHGCRPYGLPAQVHVTVQMLTTRAARGRSQSRS